MSMIRSVIASGPLSSRKRSSGKSGVSLSNCGLATAFLPGGTAPTVGLAGVRGTLPDRARRARTITPIVAIVPLTAIVPIVPLAAVVALAPFGSVTLVGRVATIVAARGGRLFDRRR